jgi:hypothetical protein
VILYDRESYYKILEIRMAQFGVKMNFLCILRVSRIVFVLKTNFYNQFSVFNYLWTGSHFLEKSGVSRKDSPDTEHSSRGWRVESLKGEGLFYNFGSAKGYGAI